MHEAFKTMLEGKDWKYFGIKNVAGKHELDQFIHTKVGLALFVVYNTGSTEMDIETVKLAGGIKLIEQHYLMMLLSPSGFSKGSKALANLTGVRLIDINEIIKIATQENGYLKYLIKSEKKYQPN